jgi:hypothetical protein
MIGGSASHAKAMEKLATSFSGRVRVLHDVRNMGELMAWADLAIAAAGTTCLEMCCLGLPAIVIEAADNQRLLARKLDAMGAAVNAGPAQSADCTSLAESAHEMLINPSSRRQLSQNAKRLVDGRGVERILCFADSELQYALLALAIADCCGNGPMILWFGQHRSNPIRFHGRTTSNGLGGRWLVRPRGSTSSKVKPNRSGKFVTGLKAGEQRCQST